MLSDGVELVGSQAARVNSPAAGAAGAAAGLLAQLAAVRRVLDDPAPGAEEAEEAEEGEEEEEEESEDASAEAIAARIDEVVGRLDALAARAFPPAENPAGGGGAGGGADDDAQRLHATFRAVDRATGGAHAPIALSWEDVDFYVDRRRKQILRGCSGTIRPGDLCAIMGPSGAGKSSLMNILAGRTRTRGSVEVKGKVMANDRPVDPLEFRSQIAYVMQEDALFATQTPREAFYFSARLRLPEAVSEPQIAALVECMIDALRLRKCCDTLVGGLMIPGISGGEKKRTAIGIELISNPSILFLDEPTSGLDSFAAFQVVNILKALSAAGRTIITTIHQPSSEVFALFDDVLLLASGRVIYHAPARKLPKYLGDRGHRCPRNYNPADFIIFLMQTQSADGLERMADDWGTSPARVEALRGDANPNMGELEAATASTKKAQVAPLGENGSALAAAADNTSNADTSTAAPPRRAGCCSQFKHLSRRECTNVIRDKRTMGARIGTTIFLNVLIGVVFQGAGDWSDVADGNPTELVTKSREHFGAIVQIFIGAMMGMTPPALWMFPIERPVFLREYALGTYGAFPYLVSKVLVEIPLGIFQATLIFLVSYWLVGFKANFFYAVLTAAMLGIVGSSLALAVGAVSTSVQAAMQAMPLLFIPQLLFAGLFVPLASIPEWIRWPQYLCFLKYALNIVLLAEFNDQTTFPTGWNSSLPDRLYHNTIWGCAGDDLEAGGNCLNEGPIYDAALFPAMDIDPRLTWLYLAIMMGSFLFFRGLALVCLVSKARE